MNAPIRRLSTVVALLFVSLLVSSTMIQFVQAKELQDRPDNRRTLLSTYARERGQILVGGTAVARSVASDDELKWLRTYPGKQLYSHLTGYYSFVYGAGGGLEGAENALLSGSSDKLFYRRISDILTGKNLQGASLELTINAKAQQAARDGLGNQRGAVVALNPKTGAILAMVSTPEYDPAQLSSHQTEDVQRAWKRLNADPDQPLVNRAISSLYPPGSTFKLVTAAAALSGGEYTVDSELPGGAVLDLPQTTSELFNAGRVPCSSSGRVTLLQALTVSCNPAFGQLGMDLGADALRAQAAKFGIGDSVAIPMTAARSSFPADPNTPQLAQSAIGQFDVLMTPLQVAMVSAAIGNDGVVMKPYLVDSVRGSDLEVIDRAAPEQMSEAVTPEVARTLTTMMESVVERGTGIRAQISGVRVAGKSGTAEHDTTTPHVWFTSFAPAGDPQVAVAVVVEDGGNAGSEAAGGRVSAPIAKAVMEAVLGQ